MGIKAVDPLDMTSWKYFTLNVLPNNPPTPNATYTTQVINLTSGQPFAYTWAYNFFTDPDAGDSVQSWFMS